jgi:hypothetical protein
MMEFRVLADSLACAFSFDEARATLIDSAKEKT